MSVVRRAVGASRSFTKEKKTIIGVGPHRKRHEQKQLGGAGKQRKIQLDADAILAELQRVSTERWGRILQKARF